MRITDPTELERLAALGRKYPGNDQPWLTIRDHIRKDGSPCLHSGSETWRVEGPDGLGICPDGCPDSVDRREVKITAAELGVKHLHRVIRAEVADGESFYTVHGLLIWVTVTEDEIRLGVSERPDSDTGEWTFDHGDLITIEA